MRRPYFSGNYGSALGSTANAANLIARAGEVQGQMYANLGQQIGGAIEKYQLNKEKRAKLEGEIEAMLPTYMQDLTMSGNEDSDKKNMSRLEKFQKGDMSMSDLQGLAGELAMRDRQATKGLDQRYKLAQIQSVEFENRFNKADEENRLLRSTLETEGAGLLNKLRESQVAVADIEKQLKENRLGVDKELLNTQLEREKASLANLQEEVTQKRNTNSVFAELHQNKLTEFALNVEQARSALAINTEKLDQLRASSDVDLKTKEAELKILEAERKELEQDLSERQNLFNTFSAGIQADKNDPMVTQFSDMNFGDAFQGDIAGAFFNTVGNIGGFFGAELTPETATEGQRVESLNALLRPAMVAQLSSRPSVYTLKTLEKILPQRGDNDQKGRTKIEALLPILRNRFKEAASTVQSGNSKTNYYQDAKEQANLLPKIILGLETALKNNEEDSISNMTASNVGDAITGKTSTNVGFRIIK
jgi:hypothetical protein